MNSVLFVDDEPGLLDGLRRSLYRERSKWHMTFAGSAQAALAQMAREPCDVIVTDIHMPQMDGTQLLHIVSERWPRTVRIILSGSIDERQSMHVVPLAHQYASKPCEPDKLVQIIARCLHLHELLHEARLRAVVGQVRQLPAIPRIYAQLTSILSMENPTIADVAAVVASDSAVVAKVLHVVNSAFFRLARSITKIDHAVAHLGFGAIRSLVLSAEVFCQWPTGPMPAGFEPERLQARAQEVAAATRALAGAARWADDALLAGLLHDIGYWVLLVQCPLEMSNAITLARTEGIALHEAETQVLGASHADVGAYLLGLWGLPYQIIEAVALHHYPSRVRQTEFDLLAALAVAHIICDAGSPNSFESVHGSTPPIDAAYLSSINAPMDWETAEKCVFDSR